MSASNDELLYEAARFGNLEELKNLLSKGAGTGYRNEVSYHIIFNDDNAYLCLLLAFNNYIYFNDE